MRFMDFCAGIGGARLGLESLGMQCLGFSEIDKNAESTYRHFFGNKETNYGDLMSISPLDLPDFDLLVAGFPCQAFSIVGQRKGLTDKRSQVIFGLLKIMNAKNIKYFILENVKGLLNHKQGQTFKAVLKLLDEGGYQVRAKIMDSSHYGLPHRRERVYFIGIRKDLVKNSVDFYSYFNQYPQKTQMKNIQHYLIDKDNIAFTKKDKKSYLTFLNYLKNKYNKGRFSIKDLLKEEFLIIDTRQSDLRLYRKKIPTLRTGRHGLLYVRENQLRRLTGYESLLLQGFPKTLARQVKNKVLENQILSQAGNAMTVNVVTACGKSLINFIKEYIKKERFFMPLKVNSKKITNLRV